MSIIILFGLFAMGLVLLFKGAIIDKLGSNNKLADKLQNATWFQNHWYAGFFLFLMNAILFVSTVGLIFISGYFNILYIHLLLMILAVVGSIYVWASIQIAWRGSKGNRLKMSTIGTGFYIFLTVLLVYWFITIEPAYEGEDTFMRAIGILFGIIVTTVASLSCFVFTGFSRAGRKIVKEEV